MDNNHVSGEDVGPHHPREKCSVFRDRREREREADVTADSGCVTLSVTVVYRLARVSS